MHPSSHPLRRLPVLLGCCALLASCNNEPMPTGPDSPQGAAEAILTGMTEGHPEAVWDAMPPSWQADVEQLRGLVAAEVDPGLYDGAVAAARKAAEVLEQKREFVLGLPMVNPAMRDRMAAPYEASLGMIRSVLASPLGSHAGLQGLDIRGFLETTGGALIDQGRAAAEMLPMIPQPPSLENVDFEFLDQEGDRALIALNHPDGRIEEEVMKQVEGKWVPESLAVDWDRLMASARGSIESFLALPPEQVEEQSGRLDKTRRYLDTLLLSKSQAEFNANFGALMSVWN